MRQLLLACVCLLPLQTPALPLRHRLSFPRKTGKLPESWAGLSREGVTSAPAAVSVGIWRFVLHKSPPERGKPSRERRHTRRRSHAHGQVMRSGCVLGTCQVHNLSHRLYQLIGQSGRQESPIDPRSPYSYG